VKHVIPVALLGLVAVALASSSATAGDLDSHVVSLLGGYSNYDFGPDLSGEKANPGLLRGVADAGRPGGGRLGVMFDGPTTVTSINIHGFYSTAGRQTIKTMDVYQNAVDANGKHVMTKVGVVVLDPGYGAQPNVDIYDPVAYYASGGVTRTKVTITDATWLVLQITEMHNPTGTPAGLVKGGFSFNGIAATTPDLRNLNADLYISNSTSTANPNVITSGVYVPASYDHPNRLVDGDLSNWKFYAGKNQVYQLLHGDSR